MLDIQQLQQAAANVPETVSHEWVYGLMITAIIILAGVIVVQWRDTRRLNALIARVLQKQGEALGTATQAIINNETTTRELAAKVDAIHIAVHARQ